uniref:Putative salivary secreted protein n=1 Tax=Ixodes ricinus TaxID=34613 RepID=A0A6B0UNZ6_IXORI
MLLVLFAVVLILPTFEAAANYFSFDPDFVCLKIIEEAGHLFCKFQGHNSLVANYSYECAIECEGNQNLRLPEEVCSKSKKSGDFGKHICTEDAKEKLNKWKDELEKRKESLSKEWCSNCKGR